MVDGVGVYYLTTNKNIMQVTTERTKHVKIKLNITDIFNLIIDNKWIPEDLNPDKMVVDLSVNNKETSLTIEITEKQNE